jgi:hypothetical protein
VIALVVFYLMAIWAWLPVFNGVRMMANVEGGTAVEVLIFTGINNKNLAIDLGAAAFTGLILPAVLITLLTWVSDKFAGKIDGQEVRHRDGHGAQPHNG